MLVTTREMLAAAKRDGYAIGAFNVENLEFIMAVLAAAEQSSAPVIMQTTPATIQHTGLDYFYAMVSTAAARAKIPVALHLDHGNTFDICMQALRAGYTSIMIDGSSTPFEDNVALTKSVVDVGRTVGIPIEAELGKIGGKENGNKLDKESSDLFTDPDQAAEFVERTGCTSLAVSIGTAHGIYRGTPHLDLGLLEKIAEKLPIPLVLHGTSGVPYDQVTAAIVRGICKVNYATELRQVYTQGYTTYLKEHPENFDPKKPAKAGMEKIQELVVAHLNALGSAGRAKP